MNYSVGKMVRNDFRQVLRPITARHIRGFCEPVKRMFLDEAVLTGRLHLPGYWSDPLRYQRAEWQPPGMESIDPARESKAMIDQITAGLRSPQEIATARGRDLEDIYREIKEAKDLAADMGITVDLSAVNTSLANNPAAIEKQGNKQSGEKGNE
jgi:capsid protein